jgi:hypothetical protein
LLKTLTSRYGKARLGLAWQGLAGQGEAWIGKARHGEAWHGRARQGSYLLIFKKKNIKMEETKEEIAKMIKRSKKNKVNQVGKEIFT